MFSVRLSNVSGFKMLVALEHHVLEQMRETAAPVRIVLRSDMIPNLHRDRETRMIFG